MPLDDADKKFITDLLAANNKAFEDKFVTAEAATKIVTQGIEKGLAGLKLDEKIAAAIPKAPEPGAGDDKGGKGGKVDPEVARLNEQLEQLKRQSAEAAAKAKEEQEKREQSELTAALRDQLTAAGVPPAQQRAAIALLHAQDKRIKRTADGTPGMHFKRTGYDDVVPLDAGIKEWLATDEGKSFLPPSGAQGTGQGAAGNAGAAQPGVRVGGKLDMKSLRSRLGAALGTVTVDGS